MDNEGNSDGSGPSEHRSQWNQIKNDNQPVPVDASSRVTGEERTERAKRPRNLKRQYRSNSEDEMRDKETELFSAIRKGKLQKVQELLRSGVRTNAIDRNNKDNTPLHYAVEKDNEEIVEELLMQNWQTCVDAKNNEGDTSLHIAALKGNANLVRILISKGANTEIENNYGEIPRDLSDDPEILDALNKPHQHAASSHHYAVQQQQQQQMRLGSDCEADDPKRPQISGEVQAKRSYDNDSDGDFSDIAKKHKIEEYSASGLKSSLHGTVYQQKLLMIVLKRGLDMNYSFRLATEMDAAEKFDDLVFQFNRKNKKVYRFLQAKHKQDEDKKISVNDLLTETDGEFSLQKYFISYRKIKRNPSFNGENDKIEDLIICTNIGFKFGDKRGDFKLDENVFDAEKNDDGSEKKDDILKTVLYRFRDNFTGKEQIVSILKNTCELVKLAAKFVDCLIDGEMVDNSKILELYGFALTKKIIDDPTDNSGNKKLHDDFINDINLWPDVKNFRDAFENVINERRNSYNLDNSPNVIEEDQELFAKEIYDLLIKHRTDKIVRVKKSRKVIKNNFDKLAGYVLPRKDGAIKFSSAFLNNQKLPGNLNDFREKLYDELDTNLSKDLNQYRFDVYKEFKTCDEIYTIDKKDFWEEMRRRRFKLSNNSTKIDANIESMDDFVEKFSALIKKSETEGDKIVKVQKKQNKDADVVSKNIDKLAHVCSEDNGEIKFSESFFNDIELPGNFDDFRSKLLEYKFQNLNEYKFQISNFPKIRLPNDSINNLETDMKGFFDNLVFAVDQPNEIKLGKIIETEMSDDREINLIDSDFIASKFYEYIVDWMKDKKGRFLTRKDGKIFFNDIKEKLAKLVLTWPTLEYRTIIEDLGIFYHDANYKRLNNFLQYSNKKQILNFVTPPNTLFGAIKVYQTLKKTCKYEKNDSYIHIRLNSLLRRHEHVVQACSVPNHRLLIIECKKHVDLDLHELYDKLRRVIEFPKKIILITSKENILANKFRNGFRDKYEEIKDEKNSFVHLTDESQNKLLKEKKLIFQGEAVDLRVFVDSESKGLINAEVLSKLIENQEIRISEPLELGDVKNYYIPRSFNRRIVIVSSIKVKPADFLVVRSSEFPESDLRQNQDIILISNSEADFEKLCRTYKDRNTHWLMEEENLLVWQRSNGTLSKLRDYVNKREQILSFHAKKVMEINEKLVIVAAEPGMGKSVVITDLAIKAKKSDPSLWVARINLLAECSSELRKRMNKKTVLNENNVAEFLLNVIKFKNDLEKELFKNRYDSGKVALFFDGYDEISPDYKDEVNQLLKFLKGANVERIWITTRPYNIGNELEDQLSTFSYRLLKFSEDDQRSFLGKYFDFLGVPKPHDEYFKTFIDEIGERFTYSQIIRSGKLYPYSCCITDKIDGMSQGSSTIIKFCGEKFTAIPLHIKMIADVFKCTFVDDYESNNKQISDEEERKPICKIDLVELYEKFFDIKFHEILYGEKAPGMNSDHVTMKKLLAKEREQVIEKHKKLALCSLLAKREWQKLLSRGLNTVIDGEDSLLGDVKYSKEKTGIIHRVVDDKPVFVHQTFAEYFAALWFTENWQLKEVRNFLRDSIFHEKYNVTRNFFDLMLAKDHGVISEIHTVVLNNDESTLKELLKSNENILTSTDRVGRTPLHLAAAYNYAEIVNHLLKVAVKIGKTEICRHKDKLFDWSPLSYAHNGSHWNVADLLLQQGGSYEDMSNAVNSIQNGIVMENETTLLHTAAKEGYAKLVHVLVSQCNADVIAVDIHNKTALHWSAQNGHLDIVKYFVDDRKVDYNIRDNDDNVPVFLAAANGKLDVVKYFIDDKKVDLTIEGTDAMVLLHLAAIKGNIKMVEYLVTKDTDKKLINKINANSGTPLHFASLFGKLDVVKYLLKNGAEFDIVDDSTPLHWAALPGRLEVVQYFMNKKCGNMEDQQDDGSTMLHLAASNGHLELVKWLMENGANLYARDNVGRTPLHSATRCHMLEVIKCLVSEDNDNLKLVDRYGDTPLHYAAGYSLESVLYFIDDRNAEFHSTNNNGQTLLHKASASRFQLPVVKYLLEEKGFDLFNEDNEGSSPLHLAARHGFLDIVKYLLNRIKENYEESIGLLFDTERYGLTPLHYAILNGQTETIDMLLEEMMKSPECLQKLIDGKYDETNNTVYCDTAETINLLIERAVLSFMSNKHHTILHEAVRGSEADNSEATQKIMHLIAEKNADYIDSTDYKGNTPLMWAALYNNADVASALIKHGANVNAVNKEGETALDLAFEVFFTKYGSSDPRYGNYWINRTALHWDWANGRLWAVQKTLVCKGADVNAVDKDGRTVLHRAAAVGNLDVVDFLIERKADYRLKDKDGDTPLHRAADRGKLGTVRYLVEVRGADFMEPNNRGMTPLQLAQEKGKSKVVNYLSGKVLEQRRV